MTTYGFIYFLVTASTGFLSRTLGYFRRTELLYMLNFINDDGSKILDYGCSTGHFLNRIKKKNPSCDLYGVDINNHAINYARKKYRNITFYELEDEFFNDKKFDIIIISHVLEHIVERNLFLRRISSILKKGGKLIIAIPQERIRGDATAFQIFFNALRGNFENPHMVTLSFCDIQGLVEKTGFEITDKIYTNYFFPSKSAKRKFYSWSLVIIAKKL